MKFVDYCDYVFSEMPIPIGVRVDAEAGYPEEFDGGFVVRRNLVVEVSHLIPDEIALYPDRLSHEESKDFYVTLRGKLQDDFWRIVVDPFEGIASDSTMLSYPALPKEDTKVYFTHKVNGKIPLIVGTIRSKFDRIDNQSTFWSIDMVIVAHQ